VRFANNLLSVVSSVNLTAVERNVIRLSDHKDPVVSYDGFRFTYAYLEQTGAATNYEAFAATFAPRRHPVLQRHAPPPHASTPSDPERNLAIASQGRWGETPAATSSPGTSRWSATSHDINGVLFDGTAFKGGVITIPTGVRAQHINIAAENTPALGATLRVRTDRVNPSTSSTWSAKRRRRNGSAPGLHARGASIFFVVRVPTSTSRSAGHET
jgi:hypothetical protein